MIYIGTEKEDLAEQWASKQLGIKASPSVYKALSGVDKSGDFSCVVLLTNFTARNIDLNIVGKKNWATPKNTIKMFNGVFNTIFHELNEGSMRKAYDNDEDMQIYGFLKEEYTSHGWCRS